MTHRVRMACLWGGLVLILCAGCGASKTAASLETQDDEPFVKPVGKSKFAQETCEEFLKQLRAALSDDGRSPDELNGVLLGGVVRAASIDARFGQPDRVFLDERPDGKPTWHWYLKDGEVALDIVEEFEQSGDKLLRIGGVSHAGY